MNTTDAILALARLDEKTPYFFVHEAFYDCGSLALIQAQEILESLGEADRVAPRALKELLRGL